MDANEASGTAQDLTQDPIYAAGRDAAEGGKGADQNPHSAGSAEYRRWADGHASVTAPDPVADDFA